MLQYDQSYSVSRLYFLTGVGVYLRVYIFLLIYTIKVPARRGPRLTSDLILSDYFAK